jgi:Flp pilus assembly protein TadD
MCRKLALAATALITGMILTTPQAHAFGAPKKPVPVAAPAEDAKPRASAEQRATAERMDPLSRAAFWAAQVNADPKDGEAGLRLAAALRALGRYQEAYEAAQSVLVMNPNDVEALGRRLTRRHQAPDPTGLGGHEGAHQLPSGQEQKKGEGAAGQRGVE